MKVDKRRPGFTLVELLVSISILVILIGLLLSGIETMKAKALATQCAGRIRNLAVMFNTYATENDGMYPQYVHSSGAPRITNPFEELKPYMGSSGMEVWHCPSDKGSGPNNQERDTTRLTRSYSINGYLGLGYTLLKIVAIPKPAQTVLIGENWSGHLPTTINGALADTVYDNLGRGGMAAVLHNRKNLGNFAFVDGHVEQLSWLQVSPKNINGHGMYAVGEDNRDGM